MSIPSVPEESELIGLDGEDRVVGLADSEVGDAGIGHVRNKIEQNTLRARVEIERRSRQAAFAQSLLVGSLSALVGAVLGVAMGHWLG